MQEPINPGSTRRSSSRSSRRLRSSRSWSNGRPSAFGAHCAPRKGGAPVAEEGAAAAGAMRKR